jgi:chromosome segregation ATPase
MSAQKSSRADAVATQKIDDPIGAGIPPAITAALEAWAQQLKDDASRGPLDRVAQLEGELAALLQSMEQAEKQRDDFAAHLSAVTAEREQALARLAELDTTIEQLTVDVRHARDVASEALVGKAKDQLAIQGEDGQLAELRSQLERQVATSAAESDKRLAAEMDLVGAVTARDNLAVEVAELRAQLDSCRARLGEV